jgi:hypothetical protein
MYLNMQNVSVIEDVSVMQPCHVMQVSRGPSVVAVVTSRVPLSVPHFPYPRRNTILKHLLIAGSSLWSTLFSTLRCHQFSSFSS